MDCSKSEPPKPEQIINVMDLFYLSVHDPVIHDYGKIPGYRQTAILYTGYTQES